MCSLPSLSSLGAGFGGLLVVPAACRWCRPPAGGAGLLRGGTAQREMLVARPSAGDKHCDGPAPAKGAEALAPAGVPGRAARPASSSEAPQTGRRAGACSATATGLSSPLAGERPEVSMYGTDGTPRRGCRAVKPLGEAVGQALSGLDLY